MFAILIIMVIITMAGTIKLALVVQIITVTVEKIILEHPKESVLFVMIRIILPKIVLKILNIIKVRIIRETSKSLGKAATGPIK